jgi:hypothetical protein
LALALTAFTVLAVLTVLTGCPTSRKMERCVLVASQRGAELSTAAENPVLEPVRVAPSHPSPVRCAGKLLASDGPDGPNAPNVPNARAPFLPDDPIDDMTAIVRGSGTVDGQPREVCPAFPGPLVEEPLGVRAPPCGPSACPNRQYRAWASGLAVHLLFYDDPGLHRPERAAETPSGACYYRLLALSLSWEGIAPQ